MTTCPTCKCSKFTIDDDAPMFSIARFECGYAVALHSDIAGGGVKAVESCRSHTIASRFKRITRRHIPAADAIEAAIIMVIMGGSVLLAESLLPEWMQWYAHFGGKLLIAAALFGVGMHVLKTFVAHIREARKRVWQSLKGRCDHE